MHLLPHRPFVLSSLCASLVSTVFLAACGGGGSSDLSRSDLIAKADPICSKSTDDVKAVKAPQSLADANVAASYFDKVAPVIHKASQDLAAAPS